MFKRLFGSKNKEDIVKPDTGPLDEVTPSTPPTLPTPITPPSPPPEPTVEIDPKEVKEVLADITGFLNDVGLNDEDIVEAARACGGSSPRVPEFGSPGDYIVSAFRNMFREDLPTIQDNKHELIHELMSASRLGMDVDRKTFDEDLLEKNLQPALGSFGVDIDFSPHDYGESFQITVRRGDLERTAEVDQSTKEMQIYEKMNIIHNLIVDFGLIYLYMDTGGGENSQYFLFEIEHLASVREKYGEFFDRVVDYYM